MNTTNPILPKINEIWWEFQSCIALRPLIATVCIRGRRILPQNGAGIHQDLLLKFIRFHVNT